MGCEEMVSRGRVEGSFKDPQGKEQLGTRRDGGSVVNKSKQKRCLIKTVKMSTHMYLSMSPMRKFQLK